MSTVIYGATGGVGSALCRRLAERDQPLVLAGRSGADLSALADELDTETSTVEVDAADPDSIKAAIDRAGSEFERVDSVANCIGSVLVKPAHRTSDDEYRETVTINLDSAFAVVRAAAQAMRREGGSIVLVSSAAARVGLPNHEAIAAAKGGVMGLTLSAAATYALRGIRVNCVAPGLTETPATEALTANDTSREASERMHALGRLGRPDEVAAMIEWLLHDNNAWVTGQTFGVDGGLATVRPPMRA
ncbi:MAG: SDR family NAD(P)-dependent oxidoreductase [Candidatus Bipolaricaulia bacterium]